MKAEREIVPGRRLGRKARKTDTRTLQLANYLAPKLPAPPLARNWTGGVTDFGMMENDILGDCTIAGCGHAVQIWTLNAGGAMVTIPDSQIEAAYAAWDGYVPGDPSTDNGGVELDVLTDWRKFGLAGQALTGFAAAKVKNHNEIRQAINLFGGVYIGLALPLTAQNQSVWDVVSSAGYEKEAGSWGGHCVYVPAYDESGFTCITWGTVQTMTTAFWGAYCDEAYALFGGSWINSGGKAPSGFDAAQLAADLAAIV